MLTVMKLGSKSLAMLLGLAVQLAVDASLACGGGGVTSASGVVTNAQRIVMASRADGTTDIVVQITVPETHADYAVLIPVPNEPTLDATPISTEELAALDDLTAPTLIEESSGGGGSGIGCGSAKSDSDSAPRGVIVSDVVEVGPVSAVSLTGEDGSAIQTWLDDNGFELPASDAGLLDDYVGGGRYFIAAKRSDRATSGAPSSIGLHYSLPGDHRQLSLAFARMGAAPVVSFTLFLAGPKPLAPSEPFAALDLNALDADLLRSGDYSAAVSDAVAGHESKAFVLESVTKQAQVASVAPKLAALIDAGSVVTRLSTVVNREALTTDAHFMRDYEADVPSQRHVQLAPLAPARSEFAFATGVVLALGLRRRSR